MLTKQIRPILEINGEIGRLCNCNENKILSFIVIIY